MFLHSEYVKLITNYCVLDEPVWSKLETGRIPQPNEIVQIIENHMKIDKFRPDF